MRDRWYVVADLLVFALGIVAGYLSRFEGLSGMAELRHDRIWLLVSPPLLVAALWAFGVYRVLWRHSSSRDFVRLGAAGAVAGLVNFILGALLVPAIGLLDHRVPLSVLTLSWLVTILGPATLRAAERMVYLSGPRPRSGSERDRRRRRLLVAGAGEAGRLIVEEMRRSPDSRLVAVGFVDSDPDKHGRTVAGLPVFGPLESLAEVAEEHGITELVIAMPSASGQVVRQLTNYARELDLEVRTLPGLLELATGKVTASSLRKVQITDLLRREPIETDLNGVRDLITGKRVLVTGAGGSIGSELCRQICRAEPAALGLLGHGENSIFEIESELRRRWPDVPTVPIIADIRSRIRLSQAYEEFAPEMVFHAAAHKHVPLMERNPGEAVTNNIVGTWNVTELAAAHGVRRLVMISTDKAVRPTSVMGASKRIAEQLVQEVALANNLNFVAVRFGNVLGSRGSVVPTFLRQISEGGPITLTHPEMRRYFMTIPEAVQLVLQASLLGQGGEVFALDMGEPVKISDLANDLIRLSGLEPGRDIEIVYTGLRPGEKLYEEVFFEGEGVAATSHPKVLWTRTPATPAGLYSLVRVLEDRATRGASAEEIRSYLKVLVPEYVLPEMPPAESAESLVPAEPAVSSNDSDLSMIG